MELRDRVAVVTGGTGGLGQRICHALAAEGCHVVAVYRQSREAAEVLVEALRARGDRAEAIQADVTDEREMARLVETVRERHGRLDVLVNNAAYNQWIPFRDLEALTPERWRFILEYNLTAPFLLSRLAAPFLRAGGGGRIVNVASTAGFAPGGSSIAYAVSKAGLVHLTRCLAVALAPEVLVNCVAPGLMEGTRMTANLAPEYVEQVRRNAALGRAADKDDVAAQVVLFARTDSITGQTVVIDAGRFYH